MLSLFADFPLNWPPVLTQMFDVQNSVGFTADSLMNLDCLFRSEKSALDADESDFSFFNAAAATIVIPFAVFLLSSMVRTAIVIRLTRFKRAAEFKLPHPHPANHHAGGDVELHERGKSDTKETEPVDENKVGSSAATVVTSGAEPSNPPKRKKTGKKKPGLVSRKFIAAWIVIFVTLQPALTKAVFGLFACQQLEDGTAWVRRDMQVGCFSPTHNRWLFYVGVPGALLYTLGIPLGAALLLYSERNNLETRAVKKKFGFLYSGCEPFPIPAASTTRPKCHSPSRRAFVLASNRWT
jgi:hypothetical protein